MATVFPSPPPTTNALSAAQRAQLVRTTSKLTRVLGHTPQVHDLRPWSALAPENDAPRRRRVTAPAAPPVSSTVPRSRTLHRSRPSIPEFSPPTEADELPPYHPTGLVTPPRALRRLSIPDAPADRGAPAPAALPATPGTPDLSPTRPDEDDSDETASLSSLASSWLTLDSPSVLSTPSTPPPPAVRKAWGRLSASPRPASPPLLRFAPSSPASASPSPARPFIAPGRAARLERLTAAAASNSSLSLTEVDPPAPAAGPAFVIPSESSLRRAKMERLRRRLGECVPVALVFPAGADELEDTLPAHHDDDMSSPVSSHFPSTEEAESPPSSRPMSPIPAEEHVLPAELTAFAASILNSRAHANAQLAEVRVPFLWRRKLDVILEHD